MIKCQPRIGRQDGVRGGTSREIGLGFQKSHVTLVKGWGNGTPAFLGESYPHIPTGITLRQASHMGSPSSSGIKLQSPQELLAQLPSLSCLTHHLPSYSFVGTIPK